MADCSNATTAKARDFSCVFYLSGQLKASWHRVCSNWIPNEESFDIRLTLHFFARFRGVHSIDSSLKYWSCPNSVGSCYLPKRLLTACKKFLPPTSQWTLFEVTPPDRTPIFPKQPHSCSTERFARQRPEGWWNRALAKSINRLRNGIWNSDSQFQFPASDFGWASGELLVHSWLLANCAPKLKASISILKETFLQERNFFFGLV